MSKTHFVYAVSPFGPTNACILDLVDRSTMLYHVQYDFLFANFIDHAVIFNP
jgi:hypothetical protein